MRSFVGVCLLWLCWFGLGKGEHGKAELCALIHVMSVILSLGLWGRKSHTVVGTKTCYRSTSKATTEKKGSHSQKCDERRKLFSRRVSQKMASSTKVWGDMKIFNKQGSQMYPHQQSATRDKSIQQVTISKRALTDKNAAKRDDSVQQTRIPKRAIIDKLRRETNLLSGRGSQRVLSSMKNVNGDESSRKGRIEYEQSCHCAK